VQASELQITSRAYGSRTQVCPAGQQGLQRLHVLYSSGCCTWYQALLGVYRGVMWVHTLARPASLAAVQQQLQYSGDCHVSYWLGYLLLCVTAICSMSLMF
jgi:hypothetical protein